MFWLLAFVAIAFLLYFSIRAFIYGNDDFWPKQGVPFANSEVLGTFWDRILVKIPFQELDARVYRYLKATGGKIKIGGLMEFRRPVAMLMDLDLARNIMTKDFDHFVNRRQFGSDADPTLFHKMLFSMNGQEWKDMRATLSPTFTTGKIKQMFEVFGESSRKMIHFLKDETRKSPEIELRDVCGRYTMDVIASAAFGVDSMNFQDKNSAFAQMGHRIQANFNGVLGGLKLFMSFLLPQLFKFLQFTFMDKSAFDFLRSVVLKTIKHRDETGEKRNDTLQLLMELRTGSLEGEEEEALDTLEKEVQLLQKSGQNKATKVKLTEELLVAQAMLYFFAGFDTVETVLIFAAYELALNPDIQEKLQEELAQAKDKDGKLSYDIVNQLEYLDMVISETLRKYPPAPRTERKCTKDYKVPESTIVIQKDTVVAIPIWSLHHDADLYPQPEEFNPERFTKENKNNRHPYAYMPFGAGPRNCIAMRFAITESKAAVANLIINFKVEPTAKTTIPMQYSTNGSLKPVDGMWLKVTPRN